MTTIRVCASRNYHVLVERGLLARCGELAAQVHAPCKAALITDDGVPEQWIGAVEDSLTQAGFSLCRHTFEHGETHKTLYTVEAILNTLTEHNLTRGDLIVAMGGGIVGDVAGFAASCYLRGIPFIQIPTTLLAAVDSSVGGKTGVNLPAGKNLAGAFYQPSAVVCDPEALSTLPPEIFADGAAESVKYGVLGDVELFEQIAAGGLSDPNQLEGIIARCIDLKRKLVESDERDTGDRQRLKLGHTVGHAIERVSNFSVTHGHAVAMGMVVITRAAAKLGYCAPGCPGRLIAALQRNGLPTRCDYPADALCTAALQDKKRSGRAQVLVIPRFIGRAELVSVPVEEFHNWLRAGLDERG